MKGIVNSITTPISKISQMISSAVDGFLPTSGGQMTGDITGQTVSGTTHISLNNVNGFSIVKLGDSDSEHESGKLTDSIHTTYEGISIESRDESTSDVSSVRITPNYVQTDVGTTTYENLSQGSYHLEVGNQSIIHYDETDGLKLNNIPEPVLSTDVTTKGYVDSTIDSKIGDYLPLSGGTVTGPITLSSDPVNASEVATKHYVDEAIQSSGGSGIVIDNHIDSNSTNPVENKVIKAALDGKVDAESGKGLSTNDFTNADKDKLDGVESGAEANVIEGVSVNGTQTIITNKIAEVSVPTKVSDLTNDSNFTSTSDVNTAISNAIASKADDNAVVHLVGAETITGNKTFTGTVIVPTPTTNDNPATKSYVDSAVSSIIGFEYSIVSLLPETGESGVLYLVANSGSNPNIYDEYIYVNNSFEKIGTTEIDLSGYLQKSGGTMTGSLILSGDPTTNLQAATKQYVDNGLAGKQNSPTIVKTTLEATNWSNGQYSFESTYPNASYDISVEPNGAIITSEQYQSWSAAQILGNPDLNVIKSLGIVPTIDIPVVLTVVAK